MWGDIQLYGSAEECCDGWLELPAEEELKSRAERAVVDKDTDKLAHHRFGVFHELGKALARTFRALSQPSLARGRFGSTGTALSVRMAPLSEQN